VRIYLAILILIVLVYFLGKRRSGKKSVQGSGRNWLSIPVRLLTRADELVKEKFKMSNQEHINSLNPGVRGKFVSFISDVERMGYVVVITGSYRTFKRSAELKKEDSRNASPGFSSHNYGTAIDINLVKDGHMIRKDNPVKDWVSTGVPQLAKEKYGMRWGGDFKGYPDNVHFDFNNKYNTEKLYAAALKQFGSVDKVQGNQVDLSKIV
jgi:hypothetical protein